MAEENKIDLQKLETLDSLVTVYCSASICKWRRDTGYYGSCHNPVLLLNYRQFMGGHVYVSPCDCERCEKNCKDNCNMEVTWKDGTGYGN